MLQGRHSINGKATFVFTVSSGTNVLMVEEIKVAFFRQQGLSVLSNYIVLKRIGGFCYRYCIMLGSLFLLRCISNGEDFTEGALWKKYLYVLSTCSKKLSFQ